jgi:hypothetical protein
LFLNGGLTSPFEEISDGVHTSASFTDGNLIHGIVLGKRSQVTIFNADQVKQNTSISAFNLGNPSESLQTEEYSGECAIFGGHFSGDLEFSTFAFRLQHQDAWTRLPGLTTSLPRAFEDGGSVTYSPPESLQSNLPDNAGRIAIEPTVAYSSTRLAGAYIRTGSRFKVGTSTPTPIRSMIAEFIGPTVTLMTLLHDRPCPPVEFTVKNSSGRWCSVHYSALVPDESDLMSPRIEERPLLTASQFGVDKLAEWFDLAKRLSPMPNLVAGVIEAEGRSVENLLLEMATAAEGLHRRLYADERRLSPEEVEAALAAITASEMSSGAKQILSTATRLYLWEPGFPQRLRALAQDVAETMPGVTGTTKKWVDAIRDARNGFAHMFEKDSSPVSEAHEFYTLHLSLRWLIMGRMLIELGIPSIQLKEAFVNFDRYQRFLRHAGMYTGSIYPPQSEVAAQ